MEDSAMARENIWRDKVATVLVTIVLTGLGTVAVQSAKYSFVDYYDVVDASKKTFDAKIAPIEASHKRWKHFADIRKQIMHGVNERSKMITGSEPTEPQNKIDRAKLMDSLRDAYSDMGSISYAPVYGTTMEAQRATLVELLKTDIDGLELLYNWRLSTGAHGLRERLKLGISLQKNLFRRAQAANAALATIDAAQIEDDDETRDIGAIRTQYSDEIARALRRAKLATWALVGSLIAYVLLLNYILASKQTAEKEPVLQDAV